MFKIIQIYNSTNLEPFTFKDGEYEGTWTCDKITIPFSRKSIICKLDGAARHYNQPVKISVKKGCASIVNTNKHENKEPQQASFGWNKHIDFAFLDFKTVSLSYVESVFEVYSIINDKNKIGVLTHRRKENQSLFTFEQSIFSIDSEKFPDTICTVNYTTKLIENDNEAFTFFYQCFTKKFLGDITFLGNKIIDGYNAAGKEYQKRYVSKD